MNCDKCNQELLIANSKLESELDSTDVYSRLTMVCTNSNCSIYAGTDLNNPKHVAKVERMAAN